MPEPIVQEIRRKRRPRLETPLGKTFHRLTVVAAAGYKSNKATSSKRLYWLCRCECGNVKEFQAQSVKNGDSKSCGCFARERASDLCKSRIPPSRKSFGEASKNLVMNFYRQRAKRYGRSFDVSKDTFDKLIQLPCYYCGALPSNRMQGKNCYGFFLYNGVDRVDNSIGYTESNCVPCCGICNRAKGAMPPDQFINLAHAIAILHPDQGSAKASTLAEL